MKRRIGYVDSLKGFAIMLVIIGHIIQYVLCPNTFHDSIVFRFIYSFHMGLFMAVSGYTVKTSYTSLCSVMQQIDKRAINLMLPFISWALIGYLWLHGYSLPMVFNKPDTGLWFLHALFFIYSIFLLSQYWLCNKKRIVRYSCIIIVFLILRKISESNLLGMDTTWISSHYLNFALGYVIADNKQWLFKKMFTPHATLLILVYMALFCLSQQTINSTIINHILSNVFYRTLRIAMIIIPLFWMAYRFEEVFKRVGMEKIGCMTLGIYAVHQPLIQQIRINFPSYYQWAASSPIGGGHFLFSVIIISIIIVKLLMLSSFTSFLFLGKNIKNHAST